MSGYKEFTGKNLDAAIDQACTHFGLNRNKLEIEIVSGGSSGIFGLVGKKKAIIKARARTAPSATEGEAGGSEKSSDNGRKKGGKPRNAKPAPRKNTKPAVKKDNRPALQKENKPVKKDVQPPAVKKEYVPQVVSQSEEAEDKQPLEDPRARDLQIAMSEASGNMAPTLTTTLPETPLENPELHKLIHTSLKLMIESIVGDPLPPIKIYQTPDRIKVLIEDEDQAGLLIGREGQTLNALQYLVNRIVAKQWETPLKVQIDAGQYRERQDDKLRQLAFYLADKVKSNGRPQSTKPLSSYHRRVVHLTLQNDEQVITRSKGEGPLKRVLILPKRDNGRQNHR